MSLGKWLAPSSSHYAAALSRGGVRGSWQTLSIAKQFGEGSRGSAVIFPADSVVLLGFLSLLCISGCIRATQSLRVPLLLSRSPPEKGIRTSVLLIIQGRDLGKDVRESTSRRKGRECSCKALEPDGPAAALECPGLRDAFPGLTARAVPGR